ncbi:MULTISPECIES: hypothetical protein [unclassified Mesorhizobium]|uniref:hypothetical protein n=1 Tax=unclassified Mesorhizobium TaxID=325217 RepID=UPI003339ADC3
MTIDVSVQPAPATIPQPTTRIIGQIGALAAPLALGACVLSSLNLGTLALLSRYDQSGALHMMSLLQPAFFLVIALMEGLSVTNQVFAARTKHALPKGSLRSSSRILAIAGLLLLCLLAASAYGVERFLGERAGAWQPTLAELPLAVLSMAAFVIFEVYHGALRGRGRVLMGLVPFAMAAAISLAATYFLLTRHQLGFDAVLLGNLAGSLVMLPLVIYLVHREARGGESMPAPQLYGRLRGLLTNVGGPVFFSILVASASAAVLFPVLDRFGKDEVSAFLIVIRLRVAFMIPAVAAGSAIAILANQSLDEHSKHGQSVRPLAVGLLFVFTLYLLATLVMALMPGVVIDAIVPQQTAELNDRSIRLLLLLLPTFFLLPCAICMQIILEQVGDGLKVLLLTIAVELATVAAVLFVLQDQPSMEHICYILIASATIMFTAFLARVLILSRRWEVERVV